MEKKLNTGNASSMHTEKLSGRTQQVYFSPEEAENYTYAFSHDVDFNKSTEIDAKDLSSSQINAKMLELIKEGYGNFTILNPGSKHCAIVGILNRLKVTVKGSLGYFCCGVLDGPNVRIEGRVGWSCGENMMSGTVVIEKNAGSVFGAAIRGGDLVCKGSVGGRTGIDQKGGTIVIGGSSGAFTGFMMQRGRIIICENAGKNLGDSMYDGVIYVGGKIQDLGVDAVEGEMNATEKDWLQKKLDQYEIKPSNNVANFTKIVSGKKLWSYDKLEPSEKKLIL